MEKRVGWILLAAVFTCQAQYWAGHPENRNILADLMDFGVQGAPGILKGKPVNFVISGYSTMAPCVDEVVYLLAQHEKATGTQGIYKVINAVITGSSLLNYVGCPPAYAKGANYQSVIDKKVSGETNVLLADQGPSGLCAPTCSESDKDNDDISGLNDPMAERYALYMDTVTSRFLRDGFDKVYFNSHLYYSGRKQGMCFQWYGMYKFFRDHPKPNVFPGPYTCGIAESFYPTGYSDSNHPTGDGPIAKIIGLGWYVTIAGEDAVAAVIKPYLDSISLFKKGTFPARDFFSTKAVQSRTLKQGMPIVIKHGTNTVKTDGGSVIRVVNLNGKTVYSGFGGGAGEFGLPELEPGVYVVKVSAGEKNYTVKVAADR